MASQPLALTTSASSSSSFLRSSCGSSGFSRAWLQLGTPHHRERPFCGRQPRIFTSSRAHHRRSARLAEPQPGMKLSAGKPSPVCEEPEFSGRK